MRLMGRNFVDTFGSFVRTPVKCSTDEEIGWLTTRCPRGGSGKASERDSRLSIDMTISQQSFAFRLSTVRGLSLALINGHGQGAAVAEVPDPLAAITLHLTAANIVFLMSAYRAKPS